MANPFDYASIEPLVDHTEVRGETVGVQFRCPETGKTVEASVAADSPLRRMTSRAAATAGNRMMHNARSAIVGAIRRFGGSGVLGRTVSDVAAGAVYGVGMPPGTTPAGTISDDERREAVVRAFREVAGEFRWDANDGRWTATKEPPVGGAFERQLQQHPLREAGDKGLLVRMILAAVQADGDINEEEREFARSFADPSLGNLQELVLKGPPSDNELGKASQGPVRETLLMAAWGAALADEKLVETEQAVLQRFAAALGVSDERSAELREAARIYILQSVLAQAFSDSRLSDEERQEIAQAGQGLGMADEEIERCVRDYRNRLGLA